MLNFTVVIVGGASYTIVSNIYIYWFTREHDRYDLHREGDVTLAWS